MWKYDRGCDYLMVFKKGQKFTESTRKKIAEAKLGEKNPMWKGDLVGKDAAGSRARRKFKSQKGKEIHHLDGNPLNNNPENIVFVTRKEHMILDGRMEALIKRNEQGKGRKASAETRVRLSISHRGSKNAMWGKKHKPETIEKMRVHALIRERDEKGRFCGNDIEDEGYDDKESSEVKTR